MDDINTFGIEGENHSEALLSPPASLEDDVEIFQPPLKTSPAVIDLDCDDESPHQVLVISSN